MLYVDLDLPRGALLEPLASAQQDVRFVADTTSVIRDGATIIGWQDAMGRHTARPARPNQGNARLVPQGDRMAMALQDGVNCGFALENVALSCPVFSMAVLYASAAGRAGTLLTLNPRDGRNYLFLKEVDGAVSLKYRDGDSAISAKTDPGGVTLVVASVNGTDMRLAVDGEPAQTMRGDTEVPPGDHDVFIGCRSDRAGIAKTLGAANLVEIRIWPDRDVFENDGLLGGLARHWQQVASDAV